MKAKVIMDGNVRTIGWSELIGLIKPYLTVRNVVGMIWLIGDVVVLVLLIVEG